VAVGSPPLLLPRLQLPPAPSAAGGHATASAAAAAGWLLLLASRHLQHPAASLVLAAFHPRPSPGALGHLLLLGCPPTHQASPGHAGAAGGGAASRAWQQLQAMHHTCHAALGGPHPASLHRVCMGHQPGALLHLAAMAAAALQLRLPSADAAAGGVAVAGAGPHQEC
jgi:hypothetical protein